MINLVKSHMENNNDHLYNEVLTEGLIYCTSKDQYKMMLWGNTGTVLHCTLSSEQSAMILVFNQQGTNYLLVYTLYNTLTDKI